MKLNDRELRILGPVIWIRLLGSSTLTTLMRMSFEFDIGKKWVTIVLKIIEDLALRRLSLSALLLKGHETWPEQVPDCGSDCGDQIAFSISPCAGEWRGGVHPLLFCSATLHLEPEFGLLGTF